MRSDFDCKLDAFGGKYAHRIRKANTLTHVLPPVFSVQFASGNPFPGDGRDQIGVRCCRLNFRQGMQQFVANRSHLRTVERVLDLETAAENAFFVELPLQPLDRVATTGKSQGRRAVDGADRNPIFQPGDTFLSFLDGQADGDHGAF